MAYSSVPSQLNHKIKSSLVKHSRFILTTKTTKIFLLENFPLYGTMICDVSVIYYFSSEVKRQES